MYNVFKAPTICELRPSFRLATGFLILFLLPILACLEFYQRFPFLVIVTIAILLSICVYLIMKYAIRSGGDCIKLLRLHKDTALITNNNLQTKSAKISSLCATDNWIIIAFENTGYKVILDQNSVGRQTYSQLSRQIRAFKVTELA